MNSKQITFIIYIFNKKFLFMKKYSDVFSFRIIVIITIKFDMKINLQFECRIHIQFDHK